MIHGGSESTMTTVLHRRNMFQFVLLWGYKKRTPSREREIFVNTIFVDTTTGVEWGYNLHSKIKSRTIFPLGYLCTSYGNSTYKLSLFEFTSFSVHTHTDCGLWSELGQKQKKTAERQFFHYGNNRFRIAGRTKISFPIIWLFTFFGTLHTHKSI